MATRETYGTGMKNDRFETRVDPDLLERFDDWWSSLFETRSEAIRWLMECVLKREVQ